MKEPAEPVEEASQPTEETTPQVEEAVQVAKPVSPTEGTLSLTPTLQP